MDIHRDVPGDEAPSVESDAGDSGGPKDQAGDQVVSGQTDGVTIEVIGPDAVEMMVRSGALFVAFQMFAQSAADLGGALVEAAIAADALQEEINRLSSDSDDVWG